MVGMVFCLLPCSSLAQHGGAARPSLKTTVLFDRVSAYARASQQAYWQQCLRFHKKPAYTYYVIAIAPYVRWYRIADWKRVSPLARKETEGGVFGAWAQVVEKGLDARGNWSDQGGYGLYHYEHGRWQRVASHEGLGYEPAMLHKMHVPALVLTRLKLDLREQ